jgi:long-subunit acyl-CoA synthetase (AMP-forming)
MQLHHLIEALPGKRSSAYVFERGRFTQHRYSDLHADIMRARDRLAGWGVTPGMRVGIYAPNSYWWLVHDLALVAIGAVSVPFTDDFSGKVNRDLLDQYNVALLLTAARHAKSFSPRPSYIAFMDGENDEVSVIPRGANTDPDQDDHHSLVFSSGSAGGLKGLVISRKGIENTLPPIFDAVEKRDGDRWMIFLPLSNLQQRSFCYAGLWHDYDVILTDYTQLFSAMKALHPTVLVAPPVLFQMIYSDFRNSPDGHDKARLAVARLLPLIPSEGLRRVLARRLFADFYAQFGDRIRLLITGMAPIRPEIGEFFHDVGLPLAESYGMVEAGSITYRAPGSRVYGSVGKLLRGVELSFREDGEILVHRAQSLTLRYFQCAEGENERTFLAPGVVATGDIGHLDKDGNLFLLGRKKEQIITPGGIKIHPEVIEAELNACPDVTRCVVFLKPGATQLTCVVDLVNPQDEKALAQAKKFAAGMRSTRTAFQHIEVILADEPFSVANGMLRPNMKVDRRAIAAKYG